jgi:hypothetical protein
MNTEKLLTQLVERLQAAYGRDLLSVVLYGSAAGEDFHGKHSDLNVLCVVRAVDPPDLEKAEPAANWWRRLGNPAPLLMGQHELESSTDAFPLEFLDIRDQHRVLYGDDPFAQVEIDRHYHRVQVEHELRAKLLALRQRYLGIHRDRKAVLGLLVDSLPSFSALFRHALILAGEQAPLRKREILERAATRFGFAPAPFLAILEVREEKRKHRQLEPRPTFEAYYLGVSRVCDAVDRL